MSDLPHWHRAPSSDEPYSRQSAAKASRLRGATVTEGLCPYCAVGCGQLIYTKAGKLIDIEGNPHRVTQVLYRAPYSDHWETRTLDWALDRIAERVKSVRDADFTVRNERGRLLNSVRSMGTLGGATIDNEENYLIKKLFGGGLGVVSIENQARI
jgi:formate dehydrogenase major subunit